MTQKHSLRTKSALSSKGFTLVELMIVIAISGILAGIAIPAYLSLKPGHSFRGAISQVRGDLNKAKMRSLENRTQCRVVFGVNSYTIDDGNRASNSNIWTTVVSRDFTNFPGTTASVGTFEFSPRGTSTSTTITVQHANGNGLSQPFTTTIAGRISMP